MLRRKKLGEFFFDVAKYSATIGVIGSLLKRDIEIFVVAGVSAAVLLSLLIGWFILPKEDR